MAALQRICVPPKKEKFDFASPTSKLLQPLAAFIFALSAAVLLRVEAAVCSPRQPLHQRALLLQTASSPAACCNLGGSRGTILAPARMK